MSRRLYRFDIIRELGRRGTNVTYEARDALEDSARTLFEWNSPTADSNTAAHIESVKGDIGDAEIFTDRSSCYIAIKPEQAKSTLIILRNRGLFTGAWADLFEAETPPPPPPQQPKPKSKWWISAVAVAVPVGLLAFWLANRHPPAEGTARAPSSVPAPSIPHPPIHPTIRSFSANKLRVEVGQSVELSWNVIDSDTVSIEPGYPSLEPALGSLKITPTKTTVFTLVAKNAEERATSDPITIVVTPTSVLPPPPPPLSVRFYSESDSVPYGKSTKLIWKTDHATSVRIEPTFDDVSPQGGILTVSPTDTTKYSLTATGASGSQTAYVTIEVVPDIQFFKSEPFPVRGCDASLLKWYVVGATGVSIDQGIGRTDLLSRLVRPTEATIYTLTAVRAGKSATARTEVPGFPLNNPACPSGLK
jgi:hypothetical protein